MTLAGDFEDFVKLLNQHKAEYMVDIEAEIIYMPFDEVLTKAKELNAIPFDLPNVEYSHYRDQCTFDYFLKKHQLNDAALNRMAAIIRGADTDRHDFAPQASGLSAIFLGLSQNIKNDHQLLDLGMILYDGLYTWTKHMHQQKHTQAPAEQLLYDTGSIGYEHDIKPAAGIK